MKQVTYTRTKIDDEFFAEIEETKKKFKIWYGRKGTSLKYLVLELPKEYEDEGEENEITFEDAVVAAEDDADGFKSEFLRMYNAVKEAEDREHERIRKIIEKADAMEKAEYNSEEEEEEEEE